MQIALYPETRASVLLSFNHLTHELRFYWSVSRLSYRVALVLWVLALPWWRTRAVRDSHAPLFVS